MGIEPTSSGLNPDVLSQLNYVAGLREAMPLGMSTMDKKCSGLETGRQASNPRLPNLRSGILSLLNYIRIRFLWLGDNPQRAAHRNG